MSTAIHLTTPVRSYDLEPDAALVVADGKVYAACEDEDDGFDQWLALTEWLSQPQVMKPSQRWQAVMVALAHGRAAKANDRRAQALPEFTSASSVLNLAKEVLGADAYAQLRAAMVEQMGLGKRS